ncbi:MAG: 50S ribosomal protein L24 [Kiritimatiellae bacterium]|nr:50S ribosomal protein L24 [Kiritimatiellia bacterium]
MAGTHIKRNDTVIAISGSDAIGRKTGRVLQVLPDKGRAIVEGMSLVKKHMRKSQDSPKGAIVQKERAVSISNLLLYCPRCKKGVKSVRRREAGKKMERQCRLCGHAFDA